VRAVLYTAIDHRCRPALGTIVATASTVTGRVPGAVPAGPVVSPPLAGCGRSGSGSVRRRE
jgi:hypothetical protein